MGLPLLLPLLLLPASLQAGGSAKCKSGFPAEVNQPKDLSAPVGGSIHIPFSFCYSWELPRNPWVRISWRRRDYHGEFIYNTTPPFIHKDYKGRLSLHWKKGQRNGSLHISNLRKEDEFKYFCRVGLTTLTGVKEMWQSINGTKLTITTATEKPTEGPTSASTSTTDVISVSGEERSSRSWPLTPGAIVGVALAMVVLKITILGLMVYLSWKSRGPDGRRSEKMVCELNKARATDRGPFHNAEEKYENIGNTGQREDPELDPKVDGILYASLVLASSTSPSAPPHHLLHNSPQKETVYSMLKA